MPAKGWRPTDEQRRHMSASHRGVTLSAEHRANVSAALRGRPKSVEHRAATKAALQDPALRARLSESQLGELNTRWHGDQVGYQGVHHRARKGLPAECAECGATERLEVSLRHDAPWEALRSDSDGVFSTRPEDYRRLCHDCHATYDKDESGLLHRARFVREHSELQEVS